MATAIVDGVAQPADSSGSVISLGAALAAVALGFELFQRTALRRR